MNVNIKKLVSYIRGQDDVSNTVNAIIGYLAIIEKKDADWSYIIEELIKYDLAIINLVESNINDINNINRLKSYGYLFNNCYEFINHEHNIKFIKEAPFNNNRVANINDYSIYILARRTHLNEYEEYKNRGK